MAFLGYIISVDGIAMDKENLEAENSRPIPDVEVLKSYSALRISTRGL